MQVTETSAEGLKRAFSIIVPANEIESRIDSRLAEIGQTANLPGFRPGKIPAGILKQRFGDSVMGEVLEEAVNSGTNQAMTENQLRPAMQPKIEVVKFEKGEDLEYTVDVEVMPEIVPTDFSKIEIEKLKAEPEESEVFDAIQRLADAQKTFTAQDGRTSEEGDAVLIDFVGSVDGEEFEGGKAEDYTIEIGSNTFIPGFEPQLVGLKSGDHKKVEVSFPEEYGSAELAGKSAVFEVDVKEVRLAEAAKIDDALAEKVGLENLDALKSAISDQLGSDYDGFSRNLMKRALLDRLAETHDFDVPPGMVDMEFEQIWSQVELQRTQAAKDGVEDEDADKPEDELKEEYREIAARRIRLGLLLSDIGQTNNIEVQQDEVNRAMAEQARQYPGQERQIVEYYQSNQDAMSQLRAPIFEDKVVDFILEMAKITERVVSVEELTKAPEEAEAKPAKKPAKKKAAAKKTAKKADADDAAVADKPKKKAAPKKKAVKKDSE